MQQQTKRNWNRNENVPQRVQIKTQRDGKKSIVARTTTMTAFYYIRRSGIIPPETTKQETKDAYRRNNEMDAYRRNNEKRNEG